MTSFAEIEKRIGYTFRDRQLLKKALIHRSHRNESRYVEEENNERLEFLGDAVLGLLIAEALYRAYPDEPEGELSVLRASLVGASSCARFFEKLGIEEALLMGRGERREEGKGRTSLLADFFEALLGAIYLDGGMEVVARFFSLHFGEDLRTLVGEAVQNWKALLQDKVQKAGLATPCYVVIGEEGPGHQRQFEVAVLVEGSELGRGVGSSKKEAQQAAAREALKR